MTTADRLLQQAQRCIQSRQLPEAQALLEALLEQSPQDSSACLLLASVILNQGNVQGATLHAVAAARMLPQDAAKTCVTAQFLIRLGEMNAARECLRNPATVRTREGRILAAIGHAHEKLGDHVQALAFLDRARDAGYAHPEFRYYRGMQLQYHGRIEAARQELESCLSAAQAGTPSGRIAYALSRLAKPTEPGSHVDLIRRELRHGRAPPEERAALEFALFEELEDLGEDEDAFTALERGNDLTHRRLNYNAVRERELFERVMTHCTAQSLRPHAEPFEGPTPIFIVGLPRSGTTLLERMLGNHSQVACAGELPDFPRQLDWSANTYSREPLDPTLIECVAEIDYARLGARYLEQTRWHARGKAYYVDKLPTNFMLLGCIHRALPCAPILHLVRDPMDVCFSNYKALFGDGSYPYSYDFQGLAAHYGHYRRLMRHWHAFMPGKILDVDYARLVSDPQSLIARILAFCNLAQEPNLAEPSTNDSAVYTLSSTQVRQPVHTRALGEWRRYASQLQPLRSLLHVEGW